MTSSNTGATTPVTATLTPSPAPVHADKQDVLVYGDAIIEQGNRLEVPGAATGGLLQLRLTAVKADYAAVAA
ncbi:hypothetical protein ACI780_06955 [Geodermatophilus sp. SYSU D00814]